MKYRVLQESATSHCCFEASVIDSTVERRGAIGVICECFSVEDAQKIVDALNGVKLTPR